MSGYAGIHRSWGFSDLNFSMFNDLQEIPDGSRDSLTRKFTKQITEDDTYRPIVTNSELRSYRIDVLHQHVQHYRIYSTNNLIAGNSKFKFTLGYQENIRREFSHPEEPDLPGLHLDLKTLTYDFKYNAPKLNGWDIILGVNGMYQTNTNRGNEFIIPDYRQFDIGPFLLVNRSVKKLDFSAGVRFDSRKYKNEPMYIRTDPSTGFDMQVQPPDTMMAESLFPGLTHTFTGLSASLGFTYNIGRKLHLKANIARGFRAPNIAEISANGVHPGTLIYQIGNISFKPEFSLQEDLGISYRSSHISGDLDFFNNNISNYIFNQKLLNHKGQDSIIVAGNDTYKFQQSKAQLYGIDAFLDIHPYDWLSFENSLSVVYAVNKQANGIVITDSTRYLPLIPPLHTNTELRANLNPKKGHVRSLYIRVGIECFARQTRVFSAYGTETPTPGYILINAGMGADIVNSRDKVLLSINILGSNITNEAYQSNMSRLKYFEEYPNNPTGRSGIYNMGRNISFKLTFPVNFRQAD